MDDGIAANQLILLTPPAISEVMYEKCCREKGKQPQGGIVLTKKAIFTLNKSSLQDDRNIVPSQVDPDKEFN